MNDEYQMLGGAANVTMKVAELRSTVLLSDWSASIRPPMSCGRCCQGTPRSPIT